MSLFEKMSLLDSRVAREHDKRVDEWLRSSGCVMALLEDYKTLVTLRDEEIRMLRCQVTDLEQMVREAIK